MAPVLFLSFVAVALWALVFLRRFGIIAVCGFTLVMGICFGYEFFHISMLTSDRLLIGALSGLYIFHRKLGIHEPKPFSKADLLGCALIAVLALSMITHDWKWNGLVPASRFVFYWVIPAAMYWVARQSHLSPKGMRNLYLGVGGFGVYLALTAFAESRGLYQFVFPRYVASPGYEEFFGRGRGPLLNPSGNGVLLTVSMACALMLLPYLRTQLSRMILGGVFLAFALGHFGTLTRCVWLGMILACAMVAYECFSYRMKKLFFVGGMFAALVVLPLNWNRLVAFKRDKNVSVADMKNSAKLRPILAYVSWKILKDKPVFGVGFGLYGKYQSHYLHDRNTNLVLEDVRGYHQHNVLLSLQGETGIIGLVLYSGLLICWSLYALRLWRQTTVPLEYRQIGLVFLCLMAGYFANGMFQDLTIMPMVHTVVAFFAGLMVSQYQNFVGCGMAEWPRKRWLALASDGEERSARVWAT